MLRVGFTIFCALGLLYANAARAEAIVALSKTHEGMIAVSYHKDLNRLWEIGDYVCAITDQDEFACGYVTALQKARALVQLEKGNAPVQMGNRVFLKEKTKALASIPEETLDAPKPEPEEKEQEQPQTAKAEPEEPEEQPEPPKPKPKPKPRAVSSVSKKKQRGGRVPKSLITETTRKEAPLSYNPAVSVGLNFGTTYVFPALNVEFPVSDHFALGARIIYSTFAKDDLKSETLGAAATVSYYSKPYSGIWVQGGAGIFAFSGQDTVTDASEKSVFPTFALTGGYRFKIHEELSAAAAVGAQYVSTPELHLLTPNYSSVRPLFIVGVGYHF